MGALMLPLQPYKLLYAHTLVEHGSISEAIQYCQVWMDWTGVDGWDSGLFSVTLCHVSLLPTASHTNLHTTFCFQALEAVFRSAPGGRIPPSFSVLAQGLEDLKARLTAFAAVRWIDLNCHPLTNKSNLNNPPATLPLHGRRRAAFPLAVTPPLLPLPPTAEPSPPSPRSAASWTGPSTSSCGGAGPRTQRQTAAAPPPLPLRCRP